MTPTRTRRLTAGLALALGLAVVPTAAGAADGYATPRPTPPPPVGSDDLAIPRPDLTVEAFDATEADGAVTGRLTLSHALTVDLHVDVSPRLIDTDQADFGCPDLTPQGCVWSIEADIPAGSTQVEVDLSVWDDDGPESAERYGFEAQVLEDHLVDVGAPIDAVLYDGSGLELSLVDDAPEALEGDPGTDGTLDLVVEANQAVPHPVSFRVRTGVVGGYNGALPGVDHEPVDVVVELPAGDTTLTVEVPLLGDQLSEPDELLFGYLQDPSHGEVAFDGGTSVARILDDDGPVVTWKRPGGYQSPSRSARSAAFTA